MQHMSIAELKAHFSEVIHLLRQGNEIVINYGRKREKIAVIVPYEKYMGPANQRISGPLKGRATFAMADDFEMTEDELLNA